MPEPWPSFSIVIPSFNRPRQLATCLDSLAGLDFPRERFEVIVVDDGSSPPLADTVDEFKGRLPLALIRQENRGPASARNAGALRASGEFVVFTDDDCTPDRDWLARLLTTLAEERDCAVGGHTDNLLVLNPFSAASQMLVDYLYGYYNRDPANARFLTSNNIAFPRRLFLAAGGFDASFRGAAAEDRELCHRWLEQGRRLRYVPEARLQHARELGLSGYLRQHFGYGSGAWRFHTLRARRGGGTFRIEPPTFYTGLLLYPFKRQAGARGFLTAALFALSQMAAALGFLRGASKNAWRPDRPLAATAQVRTK
jgi:glycosyltransferase involved in cell wall biosynthesis